MLCLVERMEIEERYLKVWDPRWTLHIYSLFLSFLPLPKTSLEIPNTMKLK